MAQRDRERERERKKRGRRKYGQAKLKHSKKGIFSCILAGAVLILLVALLLIAYFSRGTAAPIVGALGIITAGVAVGGLYIGTKGFKEREKDYLTCKIGVGCNTFFILGFILIFLRGLF